MNWTQQGFLVISDACGMPLIHGYGSEWECGVITRMAVEKLPDHLRVDLRTVPVVLHFKWEPSTVTTASERKT